jgi:hypothetical protein
MKKKLSKLAILAAAGLFATSTLVSAHHLLAPASVLCPVVGDVIQADWADVEEATKYSVNVIATYDTGIRRRTAVRRCCSTPSEGSAFRKRPTAPEQSVF